MKKLKFAKPQKGGMVRIMDKDVRVLFRPKTPGTKNGDTVRFVFNNGIGELITDTNYVTIAVQDNKLYFLGCERKEGWKLVKCNNRDDKKAVQITYTHLDEDIKTFLRISNDMSFDLEFSNEYGLYYIGHPQLKFAEKKGPGRPRKQ